MRGAFITVEGTEGVGKSTSLGLIVRRIERAGYEVVVTREPGGTDLGERIREWVLASAPGELSAETEALLMFAARSHHVSKVIKPSIERGVWVLCDRFTDATLAYQGAGRGAERNFLMNIAEAVHGQLQPDCTILLDAPVAVGFERIKDRELDHFEREGLDFFERVRQSYLDAAACDPERIKVIDASGSAESVASCIESEIDRFIQRYAMAHV